MSRDLNWVFTSQNVITMATSCYCCANHVGCCSCLFHNQAIGWSKSLRNFPKITPVTCSEWLKFGGKKNAGEKSYKFFREGYVYDIYTGVSAPEHFYAKARCYRSLKKKEEPHFSTIILRKSDDRASVYRAHCSCKAGSGGHCNHIFALLYQLNDFMCLNVIDIPSDSTCTSRPQTWHIPRSTSICPLPVMSTHFARAETDKRERKRNPVSCKLYDARGHDNKKALTNKRVMDEIEFLKNKKTPPPFSYLLCDQEPGLLVNTVFGNVPLGACLSYQLQDFGRPNTQFFKNCGVERNCDTENASPNNIQFPDIPITQNNMGTFNIAELNMLNQLGLSDFFARNVLIDIEEAHKLEKRTVLQGVSEEWLKQHKYRLTASNFGKVYFRKQSPSESMLKSIFTPRDLSNVKSISHGKKKKKLPELSMPKKCRRMYQNLQYLMLESRFILHFPI